MQGRNVILVAVAIVLGLFAVIVANAWFSGVEQKQAQVAQQQEMARIVVATQDIPFGQPLSVQNLSLAAWPKGSVPQGAFTSLEEAMKDGRVALRPIVVGEPVLLSKVSGRATLSANVPVGMLAYSIPISDVAGVSGFVRPGDMVDVLLTRQIPGDGASGSDKMTDVVLSAVPVLAIDTVADDTKTEPAVGKTATLQVDRLGAQKLALSTQLGTLTLALRNATDQGAAPARTVVPTQLTTRNLFIRSRGTGTAPSVVAASVPAAMPGSMFAAAAAFKPKPSGPTMTIVRGSTSSEYEVQRGH